MPTQKLYYENAYMHEFSAAVTACTQDKKGFAITLDRTAFYPEGGGQPFDIGRLIFEDITAEIFEVQEKQGDILHYSKTPLTVGAQVQGFIDFARRFEIMQQHTGEHIFSGLVKSEFGFDNVGFHLSATDMSIDFSGFMSAEDISIIVQKANDIILKNQTVEASFPPDVAALSYRSKKELTGDIRIVKAGQADICACCGTHTGTTGEVICISVLDSMSYKGGTRIYMACGERALKDYATKNDDCYAISHLLSCPVTQLVESVKSKLSETELLKQSLSSLKQQLFEAWTRDIPQGSIGCFEKDGMTAGDAQKLAQLINQRCDIACVSSLQQDGTVKICIISSLADTNKLGQGVCQTLGGKGGGKNGIFQCVVSKNANLAELLQQLQ